MKNLKLFFLSIKLVFLALFFVGCASSTITVPGESRIILKNLAVEYYTVAEGYLEIKNYTKAIDYYKLAMRNKELYLTSYYKIARCYALSKDWKNAAESYEYLLTLDPENVMLKTSLAYICAMSGDIDGAILKYKNLLDENPFDETLLENYVALLINVGRGEDAEESFFVLKEKFPNNKQITAFAQSLSEIVDNFDANREEQKENQNKAENSPDEKQP